MVAYSAEEADGVLTSTVAAAAAASAVVSDESSFRELDDVFLQTQTRIWIGEVLQIRIDEELNIADLLADGELLFEVSRKICKVLLKKGVDLRFLKASNEPFNFKRSGGKYMPYSNVDSFLQICKALGLAGIDLFSPSDVVEKRNTRKVCMCIRLLSKRARSKRLNVPDFDIVTYTVVMPSNMVGCIRRSWELSSCNSSSSTSHTPHHKSRKRFSQSGDSLLGNSNSFAEVSGEIDNNMMFLRSLSGNSTTSSYSSMFQSENSLSSSGGSSVVDNYNFNQYSPEECSQNRGGDGYKQYQWESLCESREEPFRIQHQTHDFALEAMQSPAESTGSTSWQRLEYDHQLDIVQFPSLDDPHIHFGDPISEKGNGAKSIAESGELGSIYVDKNMEDSAFTMDDSVESTENKNEINNRSAISCDISGVTYTKDANLLYHEEEGDVHHACGTGNYCCCFSETIRPLYNELQSETPNVNKNIWPDEVTRDEVDTVVNKKALEGSKLEEIVRFDKEEQRSRACNEDEESISVHYISPFVIQQWDLKGKCAIPVLSIGYHAKRDVSVSLSRSESKLETLHFSGTKALEESSWTDNVNPVTKSPITTKSDNENDERAYSAAADKENQEEDLDISDALDNVLVVMNEEETHKISILDDGNNLVHQDVVDNHVNHIVDRSACVDHNFLPEDVTDERVHSMNEYLQYVGKNTFQASTDLELDETGRAEKEDDVHDKNDKTNENVHLLLVDKTEATEDPTDGVGVSKTHSKPILKSILKGTAVIGVIMLLLHLRKNDGERANENGMEPIKQKKANSRRAFRAVNKKGRKHGVYPAEKLKFGD